LRLHSAESLQVGGGWREQTRNRPEVRGRRSEVGGRRSEVSGQKSEVRSRGRRDLISDSPTSDFWSSDFRLHQPNCYTLVEGGGQAPGVAGVAWRVAGQSGGGWTVEGGGKRPEVKRQTSEVSAPGGLLISDAQGEGRCQQRFRRGRRVAGGGWRVGRGLTLISRPHICVCISRFARSRRGGGVGSRGLILISRRHICVLHPLKC
jgi:hypothetical protein